MRKEPIVGVIEIALIAFIGVNSLIGAFAFIMRRQ